MIYTRYPEQIHHYSWKVFNHLEKCKFSDDDIFYHHHYDELFRNVHLQDCIDEVHWNHLRTHRTAKLIHENAGETFTKDFAKDIDAVIGKGIAPLQIYIIVMDELHRTFLTTHLRKLGITGVNIGVHNHLQKNIKFPKLKSKTEYKFSSLSRNYKPWRLKLYSKLLESNALENFVYSFYNIHAYEKTEFSVDAMRKDLEDEGITITPKLADWLERCPHTLDATDNVANKWADVTYDTIQNADLHLIVETHFDLGYYTKQVEGGERQAPSFITEKVYKAMACKKPFLVFSTPYMLKDLKDMGFKTFGDYIDESYDNEENNDKRIQMLADEINRIINLPVNEYQNLLHECEKIAQENLNILKRIKKDKVMKEQFKFVLNHTKFGTTDDKKIL